MCLSSGLAFRPLYTAANAELVHDIDYQKVTKRVVTSYTARPKYRL